LGHEECKLVNYGIFSTAIGKEAALEIFSNSAKQVINGDEIKRHTANICPSLR